MQWNQAAAVIFYTNFYGVSLEEASGSREFEMATWLSLIAVFDACARNATRSCPLPAFAARGACERSDASEYRECLYRISRDVCDCGDREDASRSPSRYAADYLALLYAEVALRFSSLPFCVLEQRTGYVFLASDCLHRDRYGLLGVLWQALKTSFLSCSLLHWLRRWHCAADGWRSPLAVAVALFFFGVVWTAIKQDYRAFLNQGSEQQEVVVSVDESVGKLSDLLAGFTWDNFTEGLDQMILRIGYTKYFRL